MSLLLPARLSWTCARSLSRVCRCAVLTRTVRGQSTKTRPRREIPFPPPPSAVGSPSSQNEFLVHTPDDALQRIKETKTTEECLALLRQATRKNIITPEIQRAVLRKLVTNDEIDEALKILKAFKTTDLISHVTLIYACTIAKRREDFKTLAEKVKNLPGNEGLALEKLRTYLGDTPGGTKKEQGEEKRGSKKGGKQQEEEKRGSKKAGEEQGESEKSVTKQTSEKQQEGENRETKEGENTKLEKREEIYDAMLEGCTSLGDTELAKYILSAMERAGLNRDVHYVRVIHALGGAGDVDAAADVLQHMLDQQVRMEHPSAFAQAAWVYCAQNRTDAALRLFDEVRARGLAQDEFAPRMLEVLAQHDMEEAVKLLNRDGPHAGADAYALIAQVLHTKKERERAILMLREVERLRLPLTRDAVLIAVKIFSKAGYVQLALKWVEKLEKEGEKLDTEVHVEVLTMLMYHGMVQAAHDKIRELRKKDNLNVEIYNVMVEWLAKRGNIEEALRLVTKQMKEDGIKPNAQSFEALMNCVELNHVQLANQALQMAKDQGIEPTPRMYASLVSGAAESGNFAQAWKMVDVIENFSPVANNELLKAYNGILNSMVHLKKPVDECEDVCKRMLSKGLLPNEETYEHLILRHIAEGNLETAFGLFEKLKELRLSPTIRTLKYLQKACSSSSNMAWYKTHIGE
eukprot:Phypoly_transcript_04590.p1 GENE.Phypoly_transcript_04590~~Phypoly_transcript_04590.p1  ORF type:complete len:690 (-),score=159.48 Phypoly_transcript_04590:54-2123(-)